MSASCRLHSYDSFIHYTSPVYPAHRRPPMAMPDTMASGFALDPIEPLLDVKQAAYLLGISVKTLRDWIQDRRIDYVKVGARVMLRPETIRVFVKKNTRRAEIG